MREYWKLLNNCEAKERLLSLLAKEDWKDFFCIDSRGGKIKYAYDEESVTRMAGAMGKSCSFYNEESATNTIRVLLVEHVNDLAEWVIGRKPMLDIAFESCKSIGFVIDESGKRTETNKFKMCLTKDLGDKTKYGFYVAAILPIV